MYSVVLASALCSLEFPPLKRTWSVLLHACHSLFVSGLLLARWLLLRAADAASPWFPSAPVRKVRICAMPHEWALKLACHVEHNEERA